MQTGGRPIPSEMKHPYFFPEPVWVPREDLSMRLNLGTPFLHELAFYSDLPTLKPWELREETVPVILEDWKELKVKLTALFENRNKHAVQTRMKKGIGLLVELLFWSNGEPVNLSEGLTFSRLKLKPANLKERFDFLLQRPFIYPAFIQLSALMEEQEKQFFRELARKNRGSDGTSKRK